MKYFKKNILLVLFAIVCGCSDELEQIESKTIIRPPLDAEATDTKLEFQIYAPYNFAAAMSIAEEYKKKCYQYTETKCPPHTEVWRAAMVYDSCTSQIVEVGECIQYFECDPLNFRTHYKNCVIGDPNNLLGKQLVKCDKGTLVYGDCVLCIKEECDGKDNDCDTIIDEMHGTCSTACGLGTYVCEGLEKICTAEEPTEEICDYLDNDCDSKTDEHQRNKCNECGPIPAEVCDNVDNDCDKKIDEDISRECFTECEEGVQFCRAGRWTFCTADLPSAEICDAEDNDCDGKIDEDVSCACTIKDVGILIPCEEKPLICGQGFKTCKCNDSICQSLYLTDCASLCAYFPIFPTCDETIGLVGLEKCNNHDDDCDGQVDEFLFKTCYSGAPETRNVGVCNDGEQYCEAGIWGALREDEFVPRACAGETLPFAKDLCNGADDNCDGIVDEHGEIKPTDIVFIIDWSGSIYEELNAIVSALNVFAYNFVDEDVIRWAIIIGPVVQEDIVEYSRFREELHIKLNFNNFSTFVTTLVTLLDELSDAVLGSLEMIYDAIYLSILNIDENDASIVRDPSLADLKWVTRVNSDPVLKNFKLNWREDPEVGKVIISFSDERGQTYLVPSIRQNTINNLVVQLENTTIYTFSPYSLKSNFITGTPAGWEEIATPSGGQWFELTSNSEEMYSHLMTILEKSVCD